MKTISMLLLGFCALAAAAAAIPPPPPDAATADPVRMLADLPDNTLKAIRRRGEIHVGVAIFVPWAMFDRNGQLVGYQVDLAKKLAEDLGVELKLVPSAPAGLIPNLHEGQIDLIASGMNVTPQRALMVSFSAPSGRSELQLLANRKLAANLHSLADFNRDDVTIAVRTGTVSESEAKRLFPKARLMPIDAPYPGGYQEIGEGKVHALLGFSPLPEYSAQTSQEVFLPLDQPVARFSEAFATRSDDFPLLQFLNSWLVAHEEDGWLAERRAYWFQAFRWVDGL